MLVIRYTGRGWLAFILFMVVGVACLLAGSAFGLRDEAFLITFAVLYVIVGVPLHWRIGTAMNASQPVHTFNGMPMEYWAVWYPVIGMVAAGGLAVANDAVAAAWAIGVGTFVGLIVYAGFARRHFQRKWSIVVEPAGRRREVAAANGWSYEEHAPRLRERWYDGYGADADRLAPARVVAGELNGMPFTVFDTTESIGSRADRRESLRTVCMVHLPVALPDVRLRGRLPDEDQLPGGPPPVADEPPWNCDILPRMVAFALIESGGEGLPMAAESDLPGFADELISERVRLETLRCGVAGWRIHGRDLIFTGIPGADAGLPVDEAMSVVAGLVAIAGVFPADIIQRYGGRPTTDVPYAKGQNGSLSWSQT